LFVEDSATDDNVARAAANRLVARRRRQDLQLDPSSHQAPVVDEAATLYI
jgi:hypothetical protein